MYLDKEIEIALLETSSHFHSNDKAKSSFGYHKGAYGALAMMKNIADEYCFATAETFCKLKVLFIHAAGKRKKNWIFYVGLDTAHLAHIISDDKVLLWSIRFIQECSMFEM